MRSQVWAYNVPFEEQDNFLIENIGLYLNTQVVKTLLTTSFQYIPIKLNTTIKIIRNQQDITPLTDRDPFPYNYIRISPTQNEDPTSFTGGVAYYYIKGSRWISRDAIELTLKLDVLNTLGTPARGYYAFDKKTHITREHRSRYRSVGSSKYFKIDKLSEGINPVIYNKGRSLINSELSTGYIHNYYLIYMNSLDDPNEPNNAIRAYVAVDNIDNNMSNIKIKYKGIGQTLSPADLSTDLLYYITDHNISITFTTIGGQEITRSIAGNNYIKLKYNNGKISVFYTFEGRWYDTYMISFSAIGFKIYYSSYEYRGASSSVISKIESLEAITTSTSGDLDGEILAFNQVDRTNPQIVKILKLPYSPKGDWIYNAVDNSILYDQISYSYDNAKNLLYVNNMKDLFKAQLKTGSLTNANKNAIISVDPTQPRSILNEPKIYHSDFAYKKLVYDSFSLMIKGEDLTAEAYAMPNAYINFYCTTTINSRFIFEIDEARGEIFENSLEDYPNTLTINRNNEMTLYNSEYINYIKNGYNYDKKKIERQDKIAGISNALGIAGAIGGAVVGGNFGASTFVNLASSTSRSIIGSLNQHIEAEISMDQKIKQLENQATSVRGADDVDLIEVYNKNKLWLYNYECSDEVKQYLFDLFYYTGYKCDYMGIPNISSRYWFNYIEADLNLSNVKAFVEEDVIQEFKNKFKAGTTIFHSHNEQFDLDQEKENWEADLING